MTEAAFLPNPIALSNGVTARIELIPMPQPDARGRYAPQQDCEIHLSFFRGDLLLQRLPWHTVINGAENVQLADGTALGPNDLYELDLSGWDQMIDFGLFPGALT